MPRASQVEEGTVREPERCNVRVSFEGIEVSRGKQEHAHAVSLDIMTVAPEGRKMLRLEVRNAETPIEKKPSWIKTKAVMGPEYTSLKPLVRRGGLPTGCEGAG